jgi:hypothetical protein
MSISGPNKECYKHIYLYNYYYINMAHVGLKYILLRFCQINAGNTNNEISADWDKLGIAISVRDLEYKVKLSLCLTN